jgi:hypothetical protein
MLWIMEPRPHRRLAALAAPILLLSWLSGVGTAAAEDVHRYVDEDGVVHLSIEGSSPTLPRVYRQVPGVAVPPSGGPFLIGPESRWLSLIAEAASYYRLPVALVQAVIRVESNFTSVAVSPAGALGMMQLMPATAQAMYVRDPFDPRENIYGGCRFLRMLLNRFDGDLVLSLAAYNAGEGAVLSRNGIPYSETAAYVRSVMSNYDRYRRQELGR